MSPPTPTLGHNWKSDFNIASPPDVGAFVTYTCDAGGHNFVKGNLAQTKITIECLKQNQMNDLASWPKCVAGMSIVHLRFCSIYLYLLDIQCPFPTKSLTIIHVETDTSKVFSYKAKVRWEKINVSNFTVRDWAHKHFLFAAGTFALTVDISLSGPVRLTTKPRIS